MTAPKTAAGALDPATRALVRVALALREASPTDRAHTAARALILATGALAGLDVGSGVDRGPFQTLADALGALAGECEGEGTARGDRAAAWWRELAAEVRAAAGGATTHGGSR